MQGFGDGIALIVDERTMRGLGISALSCLLSHSFLSNRSMTTQSRGVEVAVLKRSSKSFVVGWSRSHLSPSVSYTCFILLLF